MERVLAIIRQDVAGDKVRIDTPTQNLESDSLDVVHKARQAASETSGATSGARVAAYLRAGIEERPPAEKILERLALAAGHPTRRSAKTAGPAAAAPKVDDKKLETLTKAAETGAGAGPNPCPRWRKNRWICRRRTRNCRRCWESQSSIHRS